MFLSPKTFACNGFFATPSLMKWTSKVKNDCPVTSQGVLPSCWSNASSELMTRYLRKKGILKKDEVLSYEYYFAKEIENKTASFTEVEEESFGASLAKFLELLEDYGIITEAHYQFPIVGSGDITHKKTYKTFIEELNKSSNKKEVFNKYLATDKVNPEGIFLQSPQFISVKGTSEQDFLQMQKQIDNGLPIYMSIKTSKWLVNTMSTYAYNGLHLSFVKPQDKVTHALLIMGYKLNKKGQISHFLIKNSDGHYFGEKGYAILDRETYLKYIDGIYLLNEEI